jgi:ATP adenylyltransferase
MVLPYDHVATFDDLTETARLEMFDLVVRAIAAIESSYTPDGVNMGANLGRGAGAGIPDHLHLHVLPRWDGDTNFMTTVGGVRVLPESLDSTLERLRAGFV